MHSMTGFGRAAGETSAYRITAEARSVNHRHLEVVVRLRDPYRHFESELRSLVAARVTRGRVDLTVEVEPHGAAASSPTLRREALVGLAEQLAQVAASRPELALSPPSWSDLVLLPDMIRPEAADRGWNEEDEVALRDVCGAAVDAMVAGRVREGQGLAGALEGLSAELSELVEAIAAAQPGLRLQLAERARARLKELLNGLETPGRDEPESRSWLPEALAHAERADVTEELERLRVHLVHFRETCESPGPSGRRLEFLTQELLRELQTLSAKCRALEVSERILEAKLITERLREQVQNVE
jgi:uncharacterized protein (TIGR00255 family)